MTDDPRTDELTPETQADEPMPAPPDGDEVTPETRADEPMPAPPDGDEVAPIPHAAGGPAPVPHADDRSAPAEDEAPLFDRTDEWSGRWDGIQLRFVDEPRRSIEEADALVDEVIERLTARLADERQRLEHEWADGSEPSTEDLRLALQHYRSFFERLLAA
jgi:hypothetical protein